ncbi:MAG: c-type cytochrome, partial [Planctomycetes bacterium]|nr:c-type cytochrome [Planctomycetota bacterium]
MPRIIRTACALALGLVISAPTPAEDPPYRSPFDVAFSPDGKLLAASDRTAARVAIIDPSGPKLLREVPLAGQPTGLVWAPEAPRLFVAEYDAGTVAEVDAAEGKVLRRLAVGLRPMGVALAPRRGLLLAANTVTDDVSVVDLATGKERARVKVPREPFFLAVAPDEAVAVAGNLVPATGADDPTSSAALSFIDLEKLERTADVRLPPGSTSVREVVVSPDGKWAYAAHTLGRFNVPATQLERGWVNTNAMSILDLAAKKHHSTVLLDHPFEGAADPWGLALSKDGSTLWISLRGVHQIARVDVAGLLKLLAGELPETLASKEAYGTGTQNVWVEIKKAPERRSLLADDLSALHVAGLIERTQLEARSPRGLDLSPDGKLLAIAAYFSGSVVLADPKTCKAASSVRLEPQREPDIVRRGEALFHDASICFQHWMSCSTCHPDEGRTDGLRWDLMSDGLGTPQRTRSLLWSHRINPTTTRGVRGGIEESVPKGIEFFLRKPEPQLVEPLMAYLKSLQPEPSPFLVGGKLSERAARGKALFDGKADCVRCHEGEVGADNKAHKVGTGSPFYKPDDTFYTPKLVELYRTAPFLHDGRAATLMDVFTTCNKEKLHGAVHEISKEELEDLVEYLKA